MINILGDSQRKSRYNPNLAEKVNRQIELEEKKAELEAKRENKNKPKINPDEQPQEESEGKIAIPPASINPKDYFYVPDAHIYVAKQRTCLGKNWYDTHKELLTQGLRMPTPYEFMAFLEHLGKKRTSNSAESKEADRSWNDILKIGDYRGEWLNARFVKGTGFLGLDLEEVCGLDKDKNLLADNVPLEPCLDKDCYASFNRNSQGLLNKGVKDNSYKQGSNLYFWYPRENSVARFVASSGGAFLGCYWDPALRNAGLGVFATADEGGWSRASSASFAFNKAKTGLKNQLRRLKI